MQNEINNNLIVQPLDEFVVENYMPYCTYVITQRAIPMIDGFKPVVRRILLTAKANKMTTLGKCAVIVSDTMKIHPHGDAPVYDALVRLIDSSSSINVPYFIGKGEFGHISSSSMEPAQYRYPECKLAPIAEEFFREIEFADKDYLEDGKIMEPVTLTPSFPSILINYNDGIAVGISSTILSYNFNEVIDYTINYLKTGEFQGLLYPDFPIGCNLLVRDSDVEKINRTGVGTIVLRADYRVEEDNIVFFNFPYTAKDLTILKQITDAVNKGQVDNVVKVRNANEFNDNTNEREIKINVKFTARKSEREAVINDIVYKLFKLTDLEKTVSSDMNIIPAKKSLPKALSIPGVITTWVKFREQILIKKLVKEVEDIKKSIYVKTEILRFIYDTEKVMFTFEKLLKEGEGPAEDYLKQEFNFSDEIIGIILDKKIRYFSRMSADLESEKIANLKEELGQVENYVANIDEYLINDLIRVKRTYGKLYPRHTKLITDYYRLRSTSNNAKVIEDTSDYILIITEDCFIKKVKPYIKYIATESDIVLQCKGNDALLIFSKGSIYKLFVDTLKEGYAKDRGEYIPKFFDGGTTMSIDIITIMKAGYTTALIYDNGKFVKVDHDEFNTSKRLTYFRRGYKYMEDSELLGWMDIDLNDENSQYIAFTGICDYKTEEVNFADIPFKSRLASSKIFLYKDSPDVKLTSVNMYNKGSILAKGETDDTN